MEFLEVGKLYFNQPMVNFKFKLLTRGLNFFFFTQPLNFIHRLMGLMYFDIYFF